MRPGRQLGLLWGGTAAGLIALSPLAARLATGIPACPLLTVVGIPCPACGTTRAALALSSLDPLGALALNPLAAFAWLALVGGGLVAGVYALMGGEVREPRWFVSAGARIATVVVLLLNWGYVLRFLE